MKKIELVYKAILDLSKDNTQGITAAQVVPLVNIDRTNVSRYLNLLVKEERLRKVEGRPVLFMPFFNEKNEEKQDLSIEQIIGAEESLAVSIQQAKAAILYPPRGLHTLILGETGVGKSMFAELMYRFAVEMDMVGKEAPFVRFNCADYAENPQLLIGQIFGLVKGAYTGADKDKDGLLKKADKGIFFLDEVHRLSAQGQEMLFTFIDKGHFRRLGDTENNISSDVQIIAATTEEPSSYLLKTFQRRIPMTIRIPSLDERSLKERFDLIRMFIVEESIRIGKSIYVNKNVMSSLMLYECANNIGQLKSDIQLSCAKAFLNYKSKSNDYILIEQGDLPQHIRKALLNTDQRREDLRAYLSDEDDILKFNTAESFPGKELVKSLGKKDNDLIFYDLIELKIKELQENGVAEGEINQIVNIDIESHFEQYIADIAPTARESELNNIVSSEVMLLTEKMIKYASTALDKDFDEPIFFALALHLNGSLERIRKGQKIYHPKLNSIRIHYPEAFKTAMDCAKIMDDYCHIVTPLDEIGYITMFFTSLSDKAYEEYSSLVGHLLVMHGSSTASSMAQVVNALVGTNHCHAFDMPLSMKPQQIYDLIKEELMSGHYKNGAILHVDMGSLAALGSTLSEETGILVKTVVDASTASAIEICRKTVLGRSMEEILESSSAHVEKIVRKQETLGRQKKENLIITACFTGEGAGQKLKEIVQGHIKSNSKIKVMALNILDPNEFIKSIKDYKKLYNLMAVISTTAVRLPEVKSFTALDILGGRGLEELKDIIVREEQFEQIADSLQEHLKYLNASVIVEEIRHFIKAVITSLAIRIESSVQIGILLHTCFLIERLIEAVSTKAFPDLESYCQENHDSMLKIELQLDHICKKYHIALSKDDMAFLNEMFISNNKVEND